jgi:hypothetical protein
LFQLIMLGLKLLSLLIKTGSLGYIEVYVLI